MAFRVLSIDGGGMRGLYAATYLAALEEAFCARRGIESGLDIGKAFGLIVGVSTGAIIGCGLAAGVSTAEIAKLYREHGSSIFPTKMPTGGGLSLVAQLLTRPRHLRKGTAALRAALERSLGDLTIGSLWSNRRISLAIPAVRMGSYAAWVFKTPHNPKSSHRDDGYKLVDVCMASSAAPLFRSLAALDNPSGHGHDVFADGGLWANNPVIVAILEALRIVGDRDEEIHVYCLGSCGKPEGRNVEKARVDMGLKEWKFGADVAIVSIAAQESAFDFMARLLLPHLRKTVKIARFPSNKIPAAMLDHLDLDETRPNSMDILAAQARADADITNSAVQRETLDGVLIEELFENMPVRQKSA